MRVFGVLILFFALRVGFAQFPSELWHEGKIVLLDGDTIKGAIKYNFERDIIQLNDAKTIEAYTARNLLYFIIFDETVNQYRQFYAIPYNITPDYKTPIFFEVFYEGKLTLLGREYITIQTNTFGPSSIGSSYSRPVLAYNFYLADEKGHITSYNKNKKELLLYMSKYDTEIKNFVKRNRIRTDKKDDLIQVVQYYNSLINPRN